MPAFRLRAAPRRHLHPLRDKRGQARKPLSNGSINKTLVTLSQILDSAVERGLLPSNPAMGRKRRLKTSKPVRRLLEADELKDLLATAAEMDRTSTRYRIGHRPMIAVMAKSGLRVTEMCQLCWRDVDVHHRGSSSERRRPTPAPATSTSASTSWRS